MTKKDGVQEKDEKLSKLGEVALELYKELHKNFPTRNLDRIAIIVDLLKIEFKALSFVKAPIEQIEDLGPKLLKEIYTGIETIWNEDKKHREQRKSEKNEDKT